MTETTLDRTALEALFGEVGRIPESSRGYDVEATCRLLADAVRVRFDQSFYERAMRELESIYIDQFILTISVDSTFASRIRLGIALFL